MVTHMLEPLRKEGKSSLSPPLPQPSPWPLLALLSPGHRRIGPPGVFHSPLPQMRYLHSALKNTRTGHPFQNVCAPKNQSQNPGGLLLALRGASCPARRGYALPIPLRNVSPLGQRQPPASARSFPAQNSLPPRCGHYPAPFGLPKIVIVCMFFFSDRKKNGN